MNIASHDGIAIRITLGKSCSLMHLNTVWLPRNFGKQTQCSFGHTVFLLWIKLKNNRFCKTKWCGYKVHIYIMQFPSHWLIHFQKIKNIATWKSLLTSTKTQMKIKKKLRRKLLTKIISGRHLSIAS